jgi:hypothetical protein
MASIQCFLSQNIFSTCSVWPLKGPFFEVGEIKKGRIYFFSVFLGRSTAWMFGRTPP